MPMARSWAEPRATRSTARRSAGHTPPDAVVLASSRDHTNFYQRVVEEIAMNLPDHGGGQQDPEVRADIVYFRTPPGGGEVFSTGSIAWSAPCCTTTVATASPG